MRAGRIYGDFKLTHDYRGHSRLAVGATGAVAADHGRCSDQGTLAKEATKAELLMTVPHCWQKAMMHHA